MQFIKSLFVLIIIGFFTSASLAQLDPVVYLGPSPGSVASGVWQTTDNFSRSSGNPDLDKIILPIEVEDPVYEDELMNWDESLLPEYVYVEDPNATKNPPVNPENTVLLRSFPGIPFTGYVPPDPHLAVGPNHIIATVNSEFSIYDKDGNELKNINAGQWFAPVTQFEYGDPQVIYDHYANRWVIQFMEQNDLAQVAGNLIAVSDDDNPLGDWYIYRMDTRSHGSNPPSNTWGDYPQMGYDDEAIYIVTRLFGFSGGFFGCKIRIINKSELYAGTGGQVTWTDIWNIRDPGSVSQALDGIHPVNSYNPNEDGWFMWALRSGGALDYYIAYKITDPLTNPVLTGRRIPVQLYRPAPNANQQGGGQLIEVNGSHIKTSPVIRDGFLYGAHSVRNGTSAYVSARYFKFNLSTALIDEVGELGATGYFYIYPTITADQDHNLAVTFSRSADTEYIGAYYSSKLAADPPGLQPSQPMAVGQGNYVVAPGPPGSRNRWGDYLGICIDPENFYNAWLLSEYASATNTWGTWLTEIRMKSFTGIYPFVSPTTTDFGDVEVNTSSEMNTVIISNYGEDALVINSIADAVGPFTLESTHTFPISVPTYDTVEVEVMFSPTQAGDYDETMAITSNDPSLTGFQLVGHGYDMIEASSNILYASSGPASNGIVLTVDMQTGTGTLLGSSQFIEVTSLSVNPTNNILYGLAPESGQTRIIRINAGGGDAYELFPTNLPSLSGIAFNSAGTLYACQQAGGIYTFDLANGNSTLVTTANIDLTAIAFHPTTGVLWAAKRVFIGSGKDEVYTIDLSTGDATLIGETGFGTMTNDLAFDGSDVLYGIFGVGNQVGSLITINTSDGTGTLLGETGFAHITGLGYSLNGPPAGINDGDVTAPKEFALQQNYPNPFNPATTIKFSLPINSDVKLVVYNLLGQEVVTLLNEDRSAGTHSIVWNSSNTNGVKLSSGVYFYELKANGINGGSFQEIRKMVLLK